MSSEKKDVKNCQYVIWDSWEDNDRTCRFTNPTSDICLLCILGNMSDFLADIKSALHSIYDVI
jgi:hypothetical protein